MEIFEKQVLEMKNVLSYRGEMTQQDVMMKSRELEEIIEKEGAVKTGAPVSTTYMIKDTERGQLLDMEILIPLDKAIAVPKGFSIKEHFLLVNAIKICHKGNPALLQNTVNELNQYMAEHQLIPITSGYNVTVKDARDPSELDQVEVDIYVGISPNKL